MHQARGDEMTFSKVYVAFCTANGRRVVDGLRTLDLQDAGGDLCTVSFRCESTEGQGAMFILELF